MEKPEEKKEITQEQWLKFYNIWNFGKREAEDPIFGSQTAELMFNLLYYYTQEENLVYDVFAGSGLMNDICQKTNRQYYSTDKFPKRDFITKKDIIKEELPDIKPDFIFLDSPYWIQAREKYSDELDDLANMPLDKFYFHCSGVEGDFEDLREGDLVSFEIVPGRDGKDKAINVKKIEKETT